MQSNEEFAQERLSLCMIVRNEAEKLGRCLASAAPWVGEMIVVDTGSTDDTVSIAESFGAKVIHFPWCDDFAAARNAGLEHASRHWVLVLDADEELMVDSPEMFASILAKDSPARHHVRIQNRRENGSHTWAPVMRLFTREQPGARFRSRIHEHLPIVPGVALEQGILEGVWLRHDGYTHKVTTARNKVARNVELSRLQVADAPEDPHAWWCLATSLPPADCVEAVACFEKALELMRQEGKVGGPLLASLYTMGAPALLNAGMQERALAWLNEGLEDFPGYPDLLLHRAQLFLNKGQFEEAEQDFLGVRAARARLFHLRLIDPVTATVASRVGRGHALVRLGRTAEAEAEWLGAVPLVTRETASPFLPLAQLKLDAGAWADALGFLERELERVPDEQNIKLLAVRCHVELGQLEDAGRVLQGCPDSAAVRGCRAQILLLEGRAPEALHILDQGVPLDAESWVNAWAHVCVGDTAGAVNMWQDARCAAPEATAAGLLPLVLHVFADDPLPDGYELAQPFLVEFVRGMRFLIRNHRFDELAAIIEKGARLPSALWQPLRVNLGKQLTFDGFADVGLELLVEALKADPKQPEALYWAGFAALQLNYLEDARTFWESCLSLEPEFLLAKQGLDMLPQPPVPLVS